MSQNYNDEREYMNAGSSGFNGFGGGCGLLVVLLILFAVFSGGGIFGRGECGRGREHDRDFDELRSRFTNPCSCVSNCQIDKDVVTSRDAGIIEQKNIYEKGLERQIIERDMTIQEQRSQLYIGGLINGLMENINQKFNCLEKEIEKRPAAVPHFAATVDGCVQPQLNCFDRFRERGDFREREGCFC